MLIQGHKWDLSLGQQGRDVRETIDEDLFVCLVSELGGNSDECSSGVTFSHVYFEFWVKTMWLMWFRLVFYTFLQVEATLRTRPVAAIGNVLHSS